jgi:hypothetical protein
MSVCFRVALLYECTKLEASCNAMAVIPTASTARHYNRPSHVNSLFCYCLFSQWQLAKRNMKAAVYKRFSYLAGKCFFAWSNYVYMVALGLDRKRWPGPRKYEVRFVTA